MSSPAGGREASRAIRILSPEVAARIAAGEVVERPVSVVRELLDNAIDAGATRITLEFEEGGVRLIRVSDDGRGIAPEDVELAFERHATSKIAALDDLGRVHTLGFRGEALPSIAAAGDIELVTRVAREPVGVMVALVEGKVVRRLSRPSPPGTTMTVFDLFSRVPARRKFLGSTASESRAITVLATHYALAYPDIAFQVVSGGRRILITSGDGDIRHAFAAVYGSDTAGQMLELSGGFEGVQIGGLTGPPSVHRGNRSAISVFVNGRWVQSRALVFAVVDAYQSQLPVGRHPVAAVHIRIPDEDVDVNVHPAKAEVRFKDERAVGRAVRFAVGQSLEQSRAVQWTSPQTAGPPAPVSLVTRAADGRMGIAPLALQPPQPTQGALSLQRRDGDRVQKAQGTQRDVIPLLRVVGQMNTTYVICEGPDGMYLVDQHAAHERVVYDRLVARGEASPGVAPVQPLLEPALVELEPGALVVLEEHREALVRLGLDVELFGERAAVVRAVPVGFGTVDIPAELRSLVDQLESDARVPPGFGRAAATVACHSSIRAGMPLAMEEMRRLLEDLERTAQPRTCPHGRPTLIHLGTEAIERQFGRR